MSKLYFLQHHLFISRPAVRNVLLVIACFQTAAAMSLNDVRHESTANCDPQTGLELKSSIQRMAALARDAQDNLLRTVAHIPDTCNLKALMLTQVSLEQFHRGRLHDAMQSAQNALRLNKIVHSLSPTQAGLNSYLLGGVYASLGQHDKSKDLYLQSVRQFTRLGTAGLPLIVHVYSDLAVMCAGDGSLADAEKYLNKSIKIEQQTNGLQPAELALNHDALAHVLFLRGRTSEAAALLSSMIKDYGDNPSLNVRFRAHLYRDYGQLCFTLKQFDESIASLKKAVVLQRAQNGLPDLEMTQTILGQAYAAKKNYSKAEAEFDEAVQHIAETERNFPAQAAEVIGSYGVFLNSRKRWNQSGPLLEHALRLAESAPSDTETQIRCLAQLAEADHHLHKRKEARDLRKRSRLLSARVPANRQQENTVDLSALKQVSVKAGGR